MLFCIVLKTTFVIMVLISPLHTYAARAFYRSSKCPEPEVIQDFDMSKMIGRWYEIYSFPSSWGLGRCMQLTYRWTDQGDTVQLYWEQILKNESTSSAISWAKASSDEGFDAKLSLNFTKPSVPYSIPFWIVDTNYNNYAMVYSCYPVYHRILNTFYNAEFAWLLSRRRTMDSQLTRFLKNSLSTYGVYTQMFTTTNQSNCKQQSKLRGQNV